MSYPPQYGHPQRPQGYPQQPQGYPQQQYGYQYPPQQQQRPGYAPPPQFQQRPPAYQPPAYQPAPKRRKNISWLGLVLVVVLGGGFFAVQMTKSEPNVGQCLASMDDRFIGGLEIVPCDGASAKFEVVNKQSGRGNPSVCLDHPDGESFSERGRRGKIYWEICAVPVK